jgi:hypothetical protein
MKFLLNACESLESLEFAIRNKNNALDIFGVIEQSIEREKAIKKYSSNNNIDFSSSLIIISMRQRFQKTKNPHLEFQKFITAVLDGYEKDIDMETKDRNDSLYQLIKFRNRLN